MREKDKNSYVERERQRKKLLQEGAARKRGKSINNPSQVVNKKVDKKTEKLEKVEKKKKKHSNKEFARIMYAFVVLFICMMGYLIYFQVALSSSIINSPYNPRQDIMASQVVRGKIMDSQGNILAETNVDSEGNETRSYPMGELYAHVVGYDIMGKSGVELSNNFNLLTSNSFFVEKITNQLQEDKNQGDNVITTLNTTLQKTAYDALGAYNGAVVVMEPDTGKILTMVSKGSFDPSFTTKNWDTVSSSSESLLLNRATQGLYVPGSIFKIVTTLEYMRTYTNYRNFTYNCTGSYTLGGTTISCAGGKVHGSQDLEEAFANSCNGAFIEMGLKLDPTSMNSTAESLMFNQNLPGVFTHKSSSYTLNEESDEGKVMMTAMGQGDTTVTALHMVMISSAIANAGKLMTPYIVDSIENNTGSLVKRYSPSSYGTLMSVHEATQLTEYMKAVVENGTATSLKNNNYSVVGKTGTAEYGTSKDETHSWFIGFTNADNPDIAISVVVEKSNGGLTASSVAKKVFEAYY